MSVIEAIDEAMRHLPSRMDSLEARVLLVAIGMQESRLVHRRQIGGPARGLWQFERGGGVAGVLSHRATANYARHLCGVRGVDPDPSAVWSAMEHDDVLAAGFARLLLWSDPKPLPAVGDVDGSWACYIRTWRPGKPHPHTWPALYRQALKIVGE